ncbi:MAG: diguanylate cyclase [Treponema sp.]|nr:diguanylate cyclase [Treponema sp.]
MKKLKVRIPVFLSVLVTVIILVGIFLWFKSRTEQTIENTTRIALEENTKSYALNFYTKINDQLLLLENYGSTFGGINMNDFSQIKAAVISAGSTGIFDSVGVVNKQGRGVDSNGTEVDFSSLSFFKKAVQGKTAADVSSLQKHGKDKSIVLAVPLTQNENVEGVVFGSFSIDELKKLAESIEFIEGSAGVLFKDDGSFIVRTEKTELIPDIVSNFYDFLMFWKVKEKISAEKISSDMAEEKVVTLFYQTGYRQNIAILAPIKISGWYLAFIVPQEVMNYQSRHITGNVLVLEIAVSLSFLLILISLLYVLKNNELMSRTNEKFRIVTNQNQTIVFDYDFERRRLELTGNVAIFNEDGAEIYEGDSIQSLLKLIHPEDSSFVREMNSMRTDIQTSVIREVRLRCVNGLFYWYRLKGSVVRNDSGLAVRFVGNLVNVDEEMNKEQLLQQRAEEDTLTGLLNKGAFENYVSRILATSRNDDLFAFYIIDLDSFKKVNDTMGHLIGDKVLVDAARNLNLIFSENDYVGRIGGDEFAAFLRLSDDAKIVGEKIIEAKASAICSRLNETYSDGINEVTISASVGVAVYPQHGIKYSELFKNADGVLYKAKNSGKNQYKIFN